MCDLQVAKWYVNKARSARKLGHEFTLTFVEFKRLAAKKKCAFTGIPLTRAVDTNGIVQFDTRTIDRLDNTKGYITGNVAAVCFGANQFKSQWENPTNILTVKMIRGILNNTEKLIEKGGLK